METIKIAIIYISPSNQITNKFIISRHNESSYANELSVKIQKYLSPYNHDCIILKDEQNPYDCKIIRKNLSSALCLSIHTGFSFDHCTTGTVCYYHPKSKESIRLAQMLSDNTNALCPIKPSIKNTVKDGTCIYGSLNLIDIIKPHNLGIIAVLIEVNAHDNYETCKWLINSLDKIAESISNLISNELGN